MSTGTSLAVQWLRLWASTAGSTGSISGWGTKFSLWGQKKKKRDMSTNSFFFLKIFLMWTISKSLLNLLQYCFCFMFCFFGHEACGILAPWPGIERTLPALEGEVLINGLPGKSQSTNSLILFPLRGAAPWPQPHERSRTRTTQLSCSQIPEPQKLYEIINVYCVNLLNLGVICPEAIDNWYSLWPSVAMTMQQSDLWTSRTSNSLVVAGG